ncbi:MAG: MaoC family dehydratase [Alphaproteobacteria bacterium]|nr:MaoC family dehydratase [Alphaproteobacteria bacterium]
MDFFVAVGDTAEFTKTIGETDIAMFSAVSGDFDPIHVDEEYAKRSQFGRRIAHGGIATSLFSTTSSRISQLAKRRGAPGVSVSLGYDRIRFLAAVYPGDTLTARYVVSRLDPERGRSHADLVVVNQRGEKVCVGEHVMKWLPPTAAPT